MQLPITAIILTYNEEKNLEACLRSVRGFVSEIFIVDSGSTDATLAIAEKYQASVHYNKFETHSKQWNWGLQQLPIQNEWILGLDADQQIMPELAAELQERFKAPDTLPNGFYIKRRQYFMGKWIKHGGYYPRYLLKLFRKDSVSVDVNELMDHHFYVQGSIHNLKHDLIEDNKNETLAFWSNKHVKYAAAQAAEEYAAVRTGKTDASFFGTKDQRRLWLKYRWNKMPLFIRPLLYFLYRYFVQLGILDGKVGLIFHFLQAFWYRFLVDAKIYELKLKNNGKA